MFSSSVFSRLTGRVVFHTCRLILGDQLRTSRRRRPPPRQRSIHVPAVVATDDPDGGGRIIAASGSVGDGLIAQLRLAVDDLSAGSTAHLDLSGLVIPDPVAMRRLEAVIDHLEIVGVSVWVVGVDPAHPALA
ncbi:MAG: hypothetical protein ABIO83_00160 [Ilumatobacteraceae bacterium]